MLLNRLLIIGLAAGACTTLGATLLFVKKHWSNRSLAFFLGLAAGVMVAVVVVDMMPSALLDNYKDALQGLALGAISLAVIDKLVSKRVSCGENLINLGYLIMLGIALHDLPEGMAIALGNEMKARTGMVIALGIGIHNIPEGMAMAAPLIMGGMKKSSLLARIAAISLVTPVGTIMGNFLVQTIPGLLSILLGYASGVMIYLVIFHLWPQGGIKDRRSRCWGFWTGILIIAAATFM